MATEVFSNFVDTTLAGSIGPSATTFTVASGSGASLPQPGPGQFGRLIFTDQLTGAQHEILTYTSISGDTVSGVTRGSPAFSWAAGDIILCGPTAQTMASMQQSGQSQSNAFTYAQDTGAANAYVIAPSPAIVGTPVAGTRLYFKALAANTGASTLTVNGTAYPLTGGIGPLSANEIVANGNVTVAWNSTYSSFELVSCTRGFSATYGVAPVAMTNADVTLTLAQYAKTIITITGTLTANVNLIFPNLSGQWSIRNATTGAFTITCKTAAGSGVVVSQGAVTQILGDATNIYINGSTQQATETLLGGAEIATQTETNTGTDDVRIVTPLKLKSGFAISLTTIGYIKLPAWLGGLIIQWGQSVFAASANTVSFPLVYPNSLFCVVGTGENNTSGAAFKLAAAPNNSSFTAAMQTTTINVGGIAHWISVGR